MIDLGLDRIPPGLLVGTSSWSWPDWRGILYSDGCKERDFIGEYSRKLPTVEIDATFYRSPSPSTVAGWDERTPPGFIFSAKVPQKITHDKGLVDCGEETAAFLDAMSRLGPKLGPLVLQFGYVAKGKDPEEYRTGADHLRRLSAYLGSLPPGFRWAVEVRNRTWLDGDLPRLLADRGVALVLTDYFTMPGLPELEEKVDAAKAGFAYVRFLGDRKQVDARIALRKAHDPGAGDFDELLIDRADPMRRWIPPLLRLLERTGRVFAYFNNHYAGCGPRSVELFARLCREGR